MTRGTRLVCVSAALLLLTLVVRASDQSPAPGGRPFRAAELPAVTSEYVGSASCERCHVKEHAQWQDSLHVKMTKPIADATIVGDFSEGTTFADHDRAYTFGRKDGRPFVTVKFGQASPEAFSVDYTLGAKRYQGYLSTLPDGSIYVLPVFWHVEHKRWLDWKEITPIPDGAHGIRQIWNVNCFNCHATNIVQGYDVATKRYNSSWTEMGIGCEACHGPGREHNSLMEAWEKNPALKPAYDNTDQNRQLSDTLKILSTRSSDPRRTFDTCAYCHGNKNNVFVGFKAGDRYADFAMPFLISEPVPANDHQGEFWPDGRPNRFNRPQALTMSGCFEAGAISCASCHLSHGSKYEASLKVDIHDGRKGDELCTQCHSGPRRDLTTHTFHAPQSEGSRCINCHMSDVNWRLLIRKRDHTFQAPVPENTARFGIPNACTTCHDERSPEWASRQMDEWWGDAERRGRSVTLADTMYRAGSGDVSTLPGLASRVVRARAAEVLVAFGVVQLPGPAGEALRKAQEEYILSLDMFPDIASNHAAKGWLEAERGNTVSALDALSKATIVEPNYAFPWVVKGVLSARQGRFAEAAEMWKKARSIEPSYPNIDQLIGEAEKRKGP